MNSNSKHARHKPSTDLWRCFPNLNQNVLDNVCVDDDGNFEDCFPVGYNIILKSYTAQNKEVMSADYEKNSSEPFKNTEDSEKDSEKRIRRSMYDVQRREN